MTGQQPLRAGEAVKRFVDELEASMPELKRWAGDMADMKASPTLPETSPAALAAISGLLGLMSRLQEDGTNERLLSAVIMVAAIDAWANQQEGAS